MIVTFYSYKGGTGRTQLLSNLAAYFCFYQDKKVLMIDWDLEAPGLHFYFKEDTLQHKGLLDLMSHYCDIMQQEITVPEDKIEQEFKEGLSAYIKKDIEKSESGRGRIDLMPAGYYDDTYTRKANHFDWVKFYESLDGGFFIELLKKYLKAQDYDYIFIDSRTGISDYSGICNIQMPDANVVVIAPTDQNVKGCKRVIKRITEAEYVKNQQQRYPIIIPILSRLDPSNNKQRGKWIGKFRKEFRGEVDQLIKLSVNLLPDKRHGEIITDDIVKKYIETTLIEYQTDISYGEKILFDKTKKDIEITTIEQQFLGIAGFIEAFNNYPSVNFLFLPFLYSQVNQLFKESIKIAENEYNTFYYAVFHHDNGDLSVAKEYYSKSLNLTNDDVLKYKIQNNLAIILKETDKFDEAEKIYLKLLDKENNPDVLHNLANLYFETNQFEKSESFYNEALSNYQKLANQDSSYLTDLAEILNNLGNFYDVLNNFEKAEQTYQKALDMRKQLVQANSQTNLIGIAGILNNLAILYRNKNEYDKAEQFSQEALGIYRQFAQVNSQIYLKGAAMTLSNLATLYRNKNEYDKAEQFSQEALGIYRQLAQINHTYLPYFADALNNLANLQHAKKEFLKAEETYRESLAIRRQLAHDNPQTYLPSLAGSLNNLATIHYAKNEFEKAEEAYEEALIIRKELAQLNPQTYLPDVGTTLNNLAILYRDKNEYEKAEQTYKEALIIIKQLAQDNPQIYLSDTGTTLSNLGGLQYAKKEFVKAEKNWTEALVIRRKLTQVNPEIYLPHLGESLNNLAALQYSKKEFVKAEETLNEALVIRRQLAHDNPQTYLPDLARTLNNLGALYQNKKEFVKAKEVDGEALAIMRHLAEVNPQVYLPGLARTLINLSIFYLESIIDKEKSYELVNEAIIILQPFSHIGYIQDYLNMSYQILEKLDIDVEDYKQKMNNS